MYLNWNSWFGSLLNWPILVLCSEKLHLKRTEESQNCLQGFLKCREPPRIWEVSGPSALHWYPWAVLRFVLPLFIPAAPGCVQLRIGSRWALENDFESCSLSPARGNFPPFLLWWGEHLYTWKHVGLYWICMASFIFSLWYSDLLGNKSH